MHLFYQPAIESNPYLTTTDSRHAIKVLRLKTGEEIAIVDGNGGYYKALITTPDTKHCGVEIIEKRERHQPRAYNLHIAIAPTKNMDRIEWFVEKSTEIGIDKITPLRCANSERKVIKIERIERIMIAAAKQSQTALFPKISPLTEFENFFNDIEDDTDIFIAYCDDTPFKAPLHRLLHPSQKTLIMIGPEGDFSPKEIEIAIKNGAKVVSLGETRLRTETAGVVAVHTTALMAAINNDKT